MPFTQNSGAVANIETYNDVAGNQTININNFDSGSRNDVLETLSPAPQDRHYVQPCMEGTREYIFREIQEWLDDLSSEKNIMWIKGSPGAGKSAIAFTLDGRLREQGRLGGFFAFRRGDAALSDPTAFCRTIAYNLTEYDHGIATAIRTVIIEGQGDLRKPAIAQHFKALVKGPLTVSESYQKYLSGQYPVFILDALDECGDSHQNRHRTALLGTLMEWSRLPKSFKLILTGRDDHMPHSLSEACYQIVLATGNGVTPAASADIHAYVQKRLKEIRRDFSSLEKSNWPGPGVVQELANRAAGLFIWAETVIRFIEQDEPERQLSLILENGTLDETDSVNSLYRQIMERISSSIKRLQWAVQPLLGAIIFARAPLSCQHLADCVTASNIETLKEADVEFILKHLTSVVSVNADGVRIDHLLFRDFIIDSELCPVPLRIRRDATSSQNLVLLRSCLMTMQDSTTGLKFNICKLESSHIQNHDVHDLYARIQQHITIPLRYSCRHWGGHLADAAKSLNPSTLLLLLEFFEHHLLHWLEVMALVYNIPSAMAQMLAIISPLQAIDSKFSTYAQDVCRFITNYGVPIAKSLPHLYLSALPLAPDSSWISRTYLPRYHQLPVIIDGKEKSWAPLLNMYVGHERDVTSVAFSPDGTKIASGSNDKTVRIWDAASGELVSASGPCEGHSDIVNSVAWSPDGTKVVSGSVDMTIIIWDATSGEMVSDPFEGHSSYVTSVAFSSDGTKVASGSWDQTVRIWDSASGRMVAGPFQGHSDWVNSVAFSPDGTKVASGSEDKTIRIWDVAPGEIEGVFIGTVRPDGWITNNDQLLHWVQPMYITGRRVYPCLQVINATHEILFSYEHFAHGTSWTSCHKNEAIAQDYIATNSASDTTPQVMEECSTIELKAFQSSGHSGSVAATITAALHSVQTMQSTIPKLVPVCRPASDITAEEGDPNSVDPSDTGSSQPAVKKLKMSTD